MGSRILIRQDDGILAAQRRLQELGRIRTGWSEPYTKDGRERRRPVRSKTIVLTSAERRYLEAAAEQWGGTVERWQPQGSNPEVWRLVTEQESVEATLPPGDPLNQTMELWSGGGCVLRCDGVTEKLTNKPCVCLAKFGPDFHLRRSNPPDVCKPTSRLSVFLGGDFMPGLGLWRVETHSYYAMLEMAATIDLIKERIGPGPAIPIRLRIDPRTRLVDGKSTGYPVIVVELLGRGVVAQILSGTVDGLAIEAPKRQAIEAGETIDEVGTRLIRGREEAGESEPNNLEEAGQGVAEALNALRVDEIARFRNWIDVATDEENLRKVWRRVAEDNHLSKEQTADLTQYFWARLAVFRDRPAPASQPSEIAKLVATEEREPDRVQLWMEIVAIAGQRGWDSEQLVDEMIEAIGRKPEEADAAKMAEFLAHLRGPS